MNNILFIAPSFYGYYMDIKSAFEKQGYNVLWYEDQLERNYCNSFLKKFCKKSFSKKMENYVDSIIEKCQNHKFEKIILVLGYDFTAEMIGKLKRAFPLAEMVYYTWDSVATYPNILTFVKLFDRVYSFDDVECKNYGWHLLPLFYVNKQFPAEAKYDYSGVMSYFPNKDKNLRMILDVLPSDKQSKLHLFVKSKLYFMYLKAAYRRSVSIGINDISTNKLTKRETLQLFSESKAVIDCPLVTQHGLTMRTFEVLGTGVKLITTNKNIKKYDFYSDEYIFVVDEDTKQILSDFFDKKPTAAFSLDEKYSIDYFAKVLLHGIEVSYLK